MERQVCITGKADLIKRAMVWFICRNSMDKMDHQYRHMQRALSLVYSGTYEDLFQLTSCLLSYKRKTEKNY